MTTDHMTLDHMMMDRKRYRHIHHDVMRKAATVVTDTSEEAIKITTAAPKQNKLPQIKIKNPRFNFGKESNRLVTIDGNTVIKQLTSRAPLFISDKPVDVKGVLSWKEAMKTHNVQEEQEDKDGFNRHAFNQFASDKLGYFREIPDTRHTL